jgi:integrase
MKGSVMRDPNQTSWGYQYSLVIAGARKHVRRRGFRTKGLAEAALADALSAIGKGDRRPTIAPSAMPLGDYLDEWLTARRSGPGRTIRATTADSYAAAIRAWVRPHLGGAALRDLTPARLTAWHVLLRTRGGRPTKAHPGGAPLGTRSVVLAHTIVSKALDHAVQAGKLPTNPARSIPVDDRPHHRSVQKVERVWSADEARAFLDATRGDRLHPLWCLMLDTGCRRGEASALRWTALDLDAGTVAIRASRTHAGHEIVEGDPKTARGHRTVTLHPSTVALLRQWRRRLLEDRMAAGAAYTDTGFVFVDEIGRPYRPDGLSHRFVAVTARSGLTPIRLHDLRHTSATLLLLSGVPVHVVAGRLGHDPAVCLRTYAHFLPSSDAEAAAVLGAAIYGG